MNNVQISVVMPAYNAEQYISEAIESILHQSFKDFEFIIINDASTDNTWGIIQKYAKNDNRIIPLKNEKNLNQAQSRNIGIREAKGEYCAFMDADDISVQDRFQKQFDYMEKNPEVGILGGTMELRDINNRIIGKRKYNLSDAQIRKRIFWYSPFCHPAIMVRKSILRKIGGYDEKWTPAEDYEIYFRIGKYAKFANLDDVLLKYKIIPKSLTTGSTNKMYFMTRAIRKCYANDYPYKMNWLDRICNFLQYLPAVYILPIRFKIWLFHLFRNSK